MRACCTNAYVNDVHTEHKHKNKKKAYAYVAAVLTNISINIRLIFMLTLALISLGCHAKIVMQRIPTAAKETRIGLYDPFPELFQNMVQYGGPSSALVSS